MASVRWPALESNPESLNSYLRSLGVPEPTQVCDILGFDEALLAALPKTVYAVLLVYPNFSKMKDALKPVYEKLQEEGVKASDDIFFMQQHISNACGTFALFHALANNKDKIPLGDGALKKFLAAVENVKPGERSKVLADNADLAAAHVASAEQGETEQREKVEHHFITLLVKDGHLWELDSGAPMPRDRGACSQADFLKEVSKVVQEYVKMDPDNSCSFSALALTNAPANF